MFFCLTVAGACFLSSLAYADGGNPRSTATETEKKNPAKETKLVITGSNIPQDAKRVARIPTTASTMLIVDRREIARSGQSTAAGVLRRIPAVR